jgi:CDP-diacylglycerol--glycerol-3-phosphate 3-phosphatidyltransferase
MKKALGHTREMWKESDQRKARRQEVLEQHRIFTVANLLSLVRLFLLPPILACLLVNRPEYNILALALVIVGAITDALDGIVARARNEISQLGKIIDPVADKLFTGALGLFLVVLRGLPAWFVVLYLARDIIILTISYLLFLNRDIVMPPNRLGKLTTAVLMGTLVAYMVSWYSVGRPLVYVGAGLVVLSGLVYARNFIQLVARLIASVHEHRTAQRGKSSPEAESLS